jgi:putative glutamine amidotransferase
LFRVCAKAPDGVIEAIETHDANWFALGVQWHPEAESASALELQLFECFLQAALKGSAAFAVAA